MPDDYTNPKFNEKRDSGNSNEQKQKASDNQPYVVIPLFGELTNEGFKLTLLRLPEREVRSMARRAEKRARRLYLWSILFIALFIVAWLLILGVIHF